MIPRSRIEEANSSSSASGKFRRGLRGLGRKNSIGTRRWLRARSSAADSSPTSPISAASPRPKRDLASSAISSSPARELNAMSAPSYKQKLLLEHDLFRKPVPTFRDHALRSPQRLLALDDFRREPQIGLADRKSTRLNSSHVSESRMPS